MNKIERAQLGQIKPNQADRALCATTMSEIIACMHPCMCTLTL